MSLLRVSKCLWLLPFKNKFVASRPICSCLHTFHNKRSRLGAAIHSTRNLQTSCILFDNAKETRTSTNRLDQHLYRLDADARRTGRLPEIEIEKIIASIKRTGNITSNQGLLVIRCCGSFLPETQKRKRTQLVEDIWNTMLKLQCAVDASHYNALLKVHLDNEHKFNPVDFLNEMEKQKVEPNRVTYQRLLSVYCQDGDINGASKILEFMKSKDLPVNEVIFNELIIGHAKANNMNDARQILDVMRNAQLPPSSSTYSSLASGYALQGDIKNTLETIEKAKTEAVDLQDRDILNIIYTMAANNHYHLVNQLLPKLKIEEGFGAICVNTFLELINQGHHEPSFSLLKCLYQERPTENSFVPAALFIRQIVKQGLSTDLVIDYCNKVKEAGFDNMSLFRAAEAALIHQKSDDAIVYLKELHSQKCHLRPHFFWPLLAIKKGNDKDIYNVLRLMLELGCPADYDTFTDYSFPFLNISDPHAVIKELKDLGYDVPGVVIPFVIHLLLKNDIKTASDLLETFSVNVNPALMASRCLASAYIKSQDTASTIKVLQHSKQHNAHGVSKDVFGLFLLELVTATDCSTSLLEACLEAFKEQNMQISYPIHQVIIEKLKHSSIKIPLILESLISTELDTQKFNTGVNNSADTERQIEDFEQLLVARKAKDLGLVDVLQKLLTLHVKQKNIERVNEIIKELDESSGHESSPATLALLLELFCSHGDLDKALHYKDQIDKEFPGFRLDDYKIINLATLLAINKKYDDAEALVSNHHTKFERKDFQSAQYKIHQLLDAFTNSEDVEYTRKMFELVLGFGYCKAENVLLGPLIKTYLLRNDYLGAVNEFLRIVKTYRLTPWKSQLFKELIKLKDSDNLQAVVDASVSVHGEANTLFDLACTFIECGELHQAKKVLETPGLRTTPEKIDSICEYFLEKNLIKELESFVQITKDVFGLDRDKMFFYLIKGYAKEENPEKAIGVWETMQEENVHPSNRTLNFLGNFLQSVNQPVPFVVPQSDIVNQTKSEPAKSVKKEEQIKQIQMEEPSDAKQRSDAELFLSSLEADVYKHKNNFPVERLSTVLRGEPSLLDRVRKIADLYYKEGSFIPRNAVWNYLLKNKQYEEAKTVFESTPEMNEFIYCEQVMKHIKRYNDVEISENLLSQVRSSSLSDRLKGSVYSSHINVLITVRNLDEALDCLNQALQTLKIEHLNRGALFRLKEKLLKAGRPVPFVVPGLNKWEHVWRQRSAVNHFIRYMKDNTKGLNYRKLMRGILKKILGCPSKELSPSM